MNSIKKSELNKLESEIEFIKGLVYEKDKNRKNVVTGNLIRSMNNERRIDLLEKRTLRLAGFMTAMYIYMKGQRGFNRDRFMEILKMVSQDKRIKKSIVNEDRFK